jgi:hypothetical protein
MNDAVGLPLAAADRLVDPNASYGVQQRWWRQSLAHGMPGVALLHIELAALGLRPWRHVHDWLDHATRRPVTTGQDSHVFYGAPALAHAVACAQAVRPTAYGRTATALAAAIAATTRAPDRRGSRPDRPRPLASASRVRNHPRSHGDRCAAAAPRVVRLADVDLQHALDEGEGDESVAQWRAGHEKFWHSAEVRAELGDPSLTVNDDTLVLAQRFRLLDVAQDE